MTQENSAPSRAYLDFFANKVGGPAEADKVLYPVGKPKDIKSDQELVDRLQKDRWLYQRFSQAVRKIFEGKVQQSQTFLVVDPRNFDSVVESVINRDQDRLLEASQGIFKTIEACFDRETLIKLQRDLVIFSKRLELMQRLKFDNDDSSFYERRVKLVGFKRYGVGGTGVFDPQKISITFSDFFADTLRAASGIQPPSWEKETHKKVEGTPKYQPATLELFWCDLKALMFHETAHANQFFRDREGYLLSTPLIDATMAMRPKYQDFKDPNEWDVAFEDWLADMYKLQPLEREAYQGMTSVKEFFHNLLHDFSWAQDSLGKKIIALKQKAETSPTALTFEDIDEIFNYLTETIRQVQMPVRDMVMVDQRIPYTIQPDEVVAVVQRTDRWYVLTFDEYRRAIGKAMERIMSILQTQTEVESSPWLGEAIEDITAVLPDFK